MCQVGLHQLSDSKAIYYYAQYTQVLTGNVTHATVCVACPAVDIDI